MSEGFIESLEKARTIMVGTFSWIRETIKPGLSIVNFVENVESKIEKSGGIWGFPANICIGNTAAHYTPIQGEEVSIPNDEIVKVDIGVAVNGYVLDKALSFYFGDDDEKKAIVETANEALSIALSKIGPGVQFMDVAHEINDYVKSRGFRVVRNLYGHKIERWKLHMGDVPVHPEVKSRGVFEEGAVYAIEIFVTNGDGYAETTDDVRIYSLPQFLVDVKGRLKIPVHLRVAREIFGWVWRKRKALPFSIRHLKKKFDDTAIKVALAVLSRYSLIVEYPVLRERRGTVAQAEDTILVKKDGIEILTRPRPFPR